MFGTCFLLRVPLPSVFEQVVALIFNFKNRNRFLDLWWYIISISSTSPSNILIWGKTSLFETTILCSLIVCFVFVCPRNTVGFINYLDGSASDIYELQCIEGINHSLHCHEICLHDQIQQSPKYCKYRFCGILNLLSHSHDLCNDCPRIAKSKKLPLFAMSDFQ